MAVLSVFFLTSFKAKENGETGALQLAFHVEPPAF